MTTSLGAEGSRAYESLTTKAAAVDRSSRMRMSFTGERAKEVLGGLLTNDIIALQPGSGMRAAALTPKGRVIALLRVIDRGEDVLVDADAAAGAGFTAMIRKYVNPRLAKHTELTASTGTLGVYGPESARAVADVTGADERTLAALEPLASTQRVIGAETLTIVRSNDLGVIGYDVIGPSSTIDALRTRANGLGIAFADERATEVLRLEAGVPQWGMEMNEETIPQEANLDLLGAISFNKGCYTGQEVVARIHFRGHVNRHLRRLLAESPIEAGAIVRDTEGKDVGDVRSSADSPSRGPIALAMVRREVAPGGDVLVAHSDGRDVRAKVEAIA